MKVFFRQVRRRLLSWMLAATPVLPAVAILAGGMAFVGPSSPAHADTELLLNGSFECNDQFINNCLGVDWEAGNEGGIVRGTDPNDPEGIFEVYSHTTQQYGGFDPDTILGSNTAGDWYFHTVGLTGFDGDGVAEAPIVQQTVDISSLPIGEDFFSISAIMSGFGTDAARIELSFWDAAGGIGGGGSQVGSTTTLDGILPNQTNSNLDGSAWDNDAWSQYQQWGEIPISAVSATVQILQTSVGGTGNGNDNYVDLVSLQAIEVNPGETLGLLVNRDTGEIFLQNPTGFPLDIQEYSILSPAGTLVVGNWNSVAENYDVSGTGQVDDTNEWVEFTDPNSTTGGQLSEGSLGTGTMASGVSVSLGVGAWQQYFDESEIIFQYLDGTGALQHGIVTFSGATQTTPFPEGDINFDGKVDGLDWNAYVANLGNTFAAQTDYEAYLDGDFNNDGANDHSDYLTFRDLFEAANPLQSFETMIAGVPEPNSLVLLGLGAVGLSCLVRCKE